MPKVLPIQFPFNDVSSGVVQNVKWNLAPANSVSHAINFVFDEVFGEAVVRKGTTIVGGQLQGSDNSIQGLHFFSNSTGTVNRLLAVANTGSNNIINYFDGSNWNSALSTDTAGLKTRFVTFLDYTVRLNGTNSVVSTADGITWAANSALNDSSFPSGAKFAVVYKAQIVAAGASTRPDSAFISSVPNVAGTSISWTSGNREIVISPQDGQDITGLGVVGGVLCIFKERAMYRWNNRTTDAVPIVTVGCSSHESIVNCGSGLLAFFNPKGIFLTTGEQPVLISRRIQKWIEGMSASYYDDVAGYGDADHLYMSLGSCTVDGTTYSNIVVRYTIATKEWTVFSYAHQFKVFALFINNQSEQIVGGDTTNRVLQIESSSLTDNGTAISFQIETHDLDFGSRGVIKELSERVCAFGLNPANVLFQVKVEKQDWVTLGSLVKPIQQFLVQQSIVGHYMRFRAIGVSSTARFHLQGLETPKITMKDYSD